MKIKTISNNVTLVTSNDGEEYLFSYDTLVAGYDPTCISETENGYWYVSESYSKTSTTHIKKYLENLYTSEKTTPLGKVEAEIAHMALM